LFEFVTKLGFTVYIGTRRTEKKDEARIQGARSIAWETWEQDLMPSQQAFKFLATGSRKLRD